MGACGSSEAERQQVLHHLSETPFRFWLDDSELRRLSHHFSVQNYQKKEGLAIHRDSPGCFVVIVAGEVDVEVNDKLVCVKEPGDFMSLGVLLPQQQKFAQKFRTAGICRNTVTTLQITANELKKFLSRSSDQSKEEMLMLMGADPVKHLGGISLFKGIAEDMIMLLGTLVRYVALHQGDVLFDEGSLGRSLFIIEKGTVAAVAQAELDADEHNEWVEGVTPSLRDFKEGDFFGEIGLMIDIPRTAAIVATSDVMLCIELNRQAYQTFVRMVPDTKNLKHHMQIRTAEHFRKYNVPFFSAIPDEKYPILAKLCTIKQYQPGEVIFREGDDGDAFYIIAHGDVAVTTSNPAKPSETIEVCNLGAGKYFGEVALVQKMKRTATITTVNRCVIMSISKQNFKEFFKEAPEAVADFEVKLARYDVELSSVIYHPEGIKYFAQHLKREYSSENLDFWRTCRAFRHVDRKQQIMIEAERRERRKEQGEKVPAIKLDKQGNPAPEMPLKQFLVQEARRIVKQFVLEDAQYQVNVSSNCRQNIQTAIANAKKTGTVNKDTIFEEAEQEIVNLMSKDSFSRFKQGDLFQAFLEGHAYEEIESQSEALSHSLRNQKIQKDVVALSPIATQAKPKPEAKEDELADDLYV